MSDTFPLPELEQPCRDCPTDEDRAANSRAWEAWRIEETTAYENFVANYRPPFGAYERWLATDTYAELAGRMPEEFPERGCYECDYTGLVPTEAGGALLAFLSRHDKR